MLERDRNILKEISEKLSTERRLLKVIAYGSRIRGDYRGDSDLDVLVIVDKKDREIKDKVLSLFYQYELERDISFSLTIFSLEEFEFNKKIGSPFIESIKKEGIIFYESESRREEDTFKVPSR